MSQARRPVVNASSVMDASRAVTVPDAHACTTRRSSSSLSTGKIAWDRFTPARLTASTRSVRPVNFKNGRKFDTTQNSDNFAHLGDNDSKNPSTLAPAASSRQEIWRPSKNTR